MIPVTVIIPTFNRLPLLKRAVNSVLNQTVSDIEVIVVDDASTDGSADWLTSLSDPRVRYVRCQQNRGVAAARNRGIAEAANQWIAFLDSDDEWLPDKLYCQTTALMSAPERIIHCNERWLRNGKPLKQKSYHRKQGGRFFQRSLERCLISPSAVMIRADLFDDIGLFDESLPACEDYDLWLRINASESVAYLDDVLIIKHGGHSDQLSNTPLLDQYRIQSLIKIDRETSLNSNDRAALREVLKSKVNLLLRGALKHSNTELEMWCRQMASQYQFDMESGL